MAVRLHMLSIAKQLKTEKQIESELGIMNCNQVMDMCQPTLYFGIETHFFRTKCNFMCDAVY